MNETAKNSRLQNSPTEDGAKGKRANKYRLTLELMATAKGETPSHEPLQLEFDNHDEIFGIIERMQKRNLFQSKEQATEFAIGLKLFSEVMLKNKGLSLFEEFRPAFGAFMKKLKSGPVPDERKGESKEAGGE